MSTIDLYCTNGLSPPVRWPSRDPHVPHPGLRYYQGQWRTEAAIARKLAVKTDNERRVFSGMYYVGMLGNAQNAAVFNAWAREQLFDFKAGQAAETKAWNALTLEEKLAQNAADPMFAALLPPIPTSTDGGVMSEHEHDEEVTEPEEHGLPSHAPYYAGMTLTVESAAALNEQTREHFERRRFERRVLTENLADERQEP